MAVIRTHGGNGRVKPHLIGIAGPTGSGKTLLARLLQARLGAACPVVALDSYYRDLSALSIEERARTNFDAPDALDKDLAIAQMRALAGGHAVEKPVYDFASHTRASRTERVEPGPFVILEGIFTFCWAELCDACATRIFLEVDAAVCLARREMRDVAERGRTPESVRRQFAETVWPMYERFIEPTRDNAGLVLDATEPPEILCESALACLRGKGALAT